MLSESEDTMEPIGYSEPVDGEEPELEEINLTKDCVLGFSKNNSKLQWPYFSLPAGYTCPAATVCKTFAAKPDEKFSNGRSIMQGRDGKFYCYAATGQARYPSYNKSVWRNFDLLKTVKTSDEMADLIIKSMEFHGVDKQKVLRLHESGDFFSEEYFKAWIKVAQYYPSMLIYAYTTSIPFWLKNKGSIPKNFKLIASMDEKNEEYILANNLRYAKVFNTMEEAESAGLEVDFDDSIAAFGDESFALVLHGVQPKDTEYAKAIQYNKKSGAVDKMKKDRDMNRDNVKGKIKRLKINESQLKYIRLMEKETRDQVSIVVLLNPENKVALFKRSPDDQTNPNLWAFAGGGVDDGETPEEALCRELDEECGLSMSGFTFVRSFMYDKTKINVFTKKVDTDLDITLNDEHTEWGWFSPEEFKDLKPKFNNTLDNYDAAIKKIGGKKTLNERRIRDLSIAEAFLKKHGIVLDELNWLGSGDFGSAYSIDDKNLVLKITTAVSEIQLAKELIGKSYGGHVKIYDVDEENGLILMDEVSTDSSIEDQWYNMTSVLETQGLSPMEVDYFDEDQYQEENGESVDPDVIDFMNSVSSILRVYNILGVSAPDLRPENMGVDSNGELVGFDFHDRTIGEQEVNEIDRHQYSNVRNGNSPEQSTVDAFEKSVESDPDSKTFEELIPQIKHYLVKGLQSAGHPIDDVNIKFSQANNGFMNMVMSSKSTGRQLLVVQFKYDENTPTLYKAEKYKFNYREVMGYVYEMFNDVIRPYLQQNQKSNIREEILMEYPETFDLNTFKSLTSFKDRIAYAKEHIKGRGKRGSSRMVLPIDDEKVLKIALNKAGLAQNEAEVENWLNLKAINREYTAAPVLDWDDQNYFYIEMKRVNLLNNTKFKQLFGVDGELFFEYLQQRVNELSNKRIRYNIVNQSNQEMITKIAEMDIFNQLADTYLDLDGSLTVRDAYLANYGYYIEDGEPQLVMLDYGLSDDVARTHYS